MKYINYKKIKEQIKKKYVSQNSIFNFLCHNKLPCFNKCCRNVNIFLYPYDVLRLKNKLKKKSFLFIEEYLNIILRNENLFPDVLLQMDKNNDMKCPFLKKNGCSVYYDRPYSCRMFPIETGILDGSNSIINLFKPPIFCKGDFVDSEWSISDWIKNQQIEFYQKMTINWSNIKKIFYKNQLKNFQSKKIEMAFISVYNLDEFRKFIFESSFLKRYKIENNFLEKIKKNDTLLLKLGFEWIRFYMWGITSKVIISK